MSTNLPFERRLATWMADEAAMSVPAGAIDEALSVTGRLRPRPRWLALLRETPMRQHTIVVVGSPTRRLALAGAIALLLIAASVAVGSYLIRTTRTGAAADWPTFRGGYARTGESFDGPVGSPVLKWHAEVQGAPNSVSVVDGTVFVATDAGVLKALDLATGRDRWTFVSTAYPAGLVGPSIVGDLAYVSDGLGTVHAVDIASGKERWHASREYTGAGPVTFGLGRVYTGTDSGRVVALDAQTGTEAWTLVVPRGGVLHTAAFADGRVFIAGDTAGLVAIDAATGKVAWQVDLGLVEPGTTVVADGIVYTGLGNDRTSAHLRAIDAKTGKLLWQKREHFQAPAVSNGIAYVTDNNGLVAALRESDGSELWRAHVPADSRAPAVANGVVYVATIEPGHVYAMDATTGHALWDLPVSSNVTCCVEVTNGFVLAPGDDGNLYVIGGKRE